MGVQYEVGLAAAIPLANSVAVHGAPTGNTSVSRVQSWACVPVSAKTATPVSTVTVCAPCNREMLGFPGNLTCDELLEVNETIAIPFLAPLLTRGAARTQSEESLNHRFNESASRSKPVAFK